MFNKKIFPVISLTLLFLLVAVTGYEAAGAAVRHMENRADTVRTVYPENRLKDLLADRSKPEHNAGKDKNPGLCENNDYEDDRWDFTEEEMDIFARLVHAEAKGESYRGKVAVAAAVLNRIESDVYPDDLKSVIFQVDSGYYQFSPVLDGSIWQTPDEEAYQAVEDAIDGEDPSKGAISFYNPRKTGNRWVRQQTVTTVIGNHVFFKLAQ